MAEMNYQDLLGIPHAPGDSTGESGGLDCAGVVLRALGRIGGPELAGQFRAALDGDEAKAWTPVSVDAVRIGDVITTETPDGPHVAVVVSDSPPIALSSAKRLGSYAVPLSRIKSITGAYRAPEGE